MRNVLDIFLNFKTAVWSQADGPNGPYETIILDPITYARTSIRFYMSLVH